MAKLKSYANKNTDEATSLPEIKMVSELAQQNNIETYIVGGFVRDFFLDRPCKDLDFVVLGSGISLAEKVGLKTGIKVNIFKTFGTAQLNYGDYDLEFVGARKESYQSDSRKPIVENGTLADDQNRRDFTINAMAFSINKNNYGQLVDPFNGISDLENKIIRTPLDPNITYSDDPLRMMRAIRFATQLNFTIEEKSFEAIKTNKHRIKIISKERITDELNKIILSPTPSVGFKYLFDSGLLPLIFPELAKLQGVEVKNGMSHKDNFYHTLQVLDNISLKTDNLWLRWAAVLHDIAKPPTKRFSPQNGWTFHGHEDLGARWVPGIFQRLKLPLDHKMKYVQKLVALHLRPISLTFDGVTDSAIRRLLFEIGDDLEDLMTLCEADITTRNKAKEERYLQRFQKVREVVLEVEERDKIRNWQPPITGEIIMKTFGLEPCREVGVIKNAIRDGILDGNIKNDYDEAFKFMLNLGQELGLKKI